MDYKKVGVVSSVVLAYSGFTASIPVQATTVSTDSFALQDDHEKPVDLTIKQQTRTDHGSLKEEALSSDEAAEPLETSESTQMSTEDSEDSTAASESSTNSQTSNSTTESTSAETVTSKPVKPAKPSVSTSSSSEKQTEKTSSTKETSETKESKESEKTEDSSEEAIPTIIYYSPNYSTQQFVNQIAEQTRIIGQERDLYASVMIAQAILESSSGNSGLASPPNYNLFGIKGSYGGQTVRFSTSEDNGGGKLHKVNANFRKYSSYKESLEDYANLLSRNLYSGARKSNTSNYQEATSFLTGRYATDTSYGAKLNGLIQAYDLTQYDNPVEKAPELPKEKAPSKQTAKSIKVEKKADKKVSELPATVEQGFIMHEVQPGESLKKISEQYGTPISDIIEQNQLNRLVLMVGQLLKVETNIRPSQIDQTAIESDTRTKQDILVTKKIAEIIPEPVFKTSDLYYKITAVSALPIDSYQVQRGDSLLKISKKVGLSVQSIREWNQLEGYLLREGQILRITPVLSV